MVAKVFLRCKFILNRSHFFSVFLSEYNICFRQLLAGIISYPHNCHLRYMVFGERAIIPLLTI